MSRIWLVAAENGALKGGKVGGIADVIRDLPPALAALGHQVTVITPAYGIFDKLPQAHHVGRLPVQFSGTPHDVQIWQIGSSSSAPSVKLIALEHALLSPKGVGVIYHDDGSVAPYATDASRFAFFCAATVAYVGQCDNPPEVLHLHDWHLGLVLVLRHYAHSWHTIRRMRIVFTIHNLAFQGIRPLKNHPSSFETWFPRLRYRRKQIADPRYTDCVNPMAAAIRLADKLNTVSPTYAGEILQPNDRQSGFSGGEGLEADLRVAATENRLIGILNGCCYGGSYLRRGRGRAGWSRLLQTIIDEKHLLKDNLVAQHTLMQLPRRRPAKLLVSIGRIGEQKISLLLQPTQTHHSALEMILQQHGRSLVFIMLGSGNGELEKRLHGIAAEHRNFLFLSGYSATLSDWLYCLGDLFLMPSSFEPCGISQMLAMRVGQPCVVHAVGGLKDTVTDGVNGFVFVGKTPRAQAENFVLSVNRALRIKSTDQQRWQKIRNHAKSTRFSWETAAASYLSDLYEFTTGYRADNQPDRRAILQELADGRHRNPFALLGIHTENGVRMVRTLQPHAKSVTLLDRLGKVLLPMRRVHAGGIFEAPMSARKRHYRLRIEAKSGATVDVEDAYRLPSMLGDLPLVTEGYRMTDGTHQGIFNQPDFNQLGAQPTRLFGLSGTRFSVWAPNALRVSVIGDFNDWDGRRHVMRLHPDSGVWEIFIPAVAVGSYYKYEILDQQGNLLPLKTDPMAHFFEPPPGNASIVYRSHHRWRDHAWMKQRRNVPQLDQPLSIYEVHLGSWRRNPGNRPLSYRELAHQLVDYVVEMEFTHIELLPVTEHPFDGSWGYQPIGMYAPTQRFGKPDDFRYFIDCCHRADIAVILDWVPAHFPRDPHGLGRFDGSALYEHQDPRKGEHADWGTLIFNYGRHEVINYLIGNALYWIDEFHIDALRVDAVASMLYLDYSRKAGEWLANRHGGNENLEAVDFIRRLNIAVHAHGACCFAEESTAWPGVSHPTDSGGLGFTYKWNMGWMNDTLAYMREQPIHRKHHHDKMSFGLVYAFNENFVLPLSHDEVVHGKGSLLGYMPGDDWQRFANLRAYLGFMYAHPGKKLLFMGAELAQQNEWHHDHALDWHLLAQPRHQGIQMLVRNLNRIYRATPALYQQDFKHAGFEWIDWQDSDNSVLSWIRRANNGDFVICLSNFTPVVRDYRIGVPAAGDYHELLNTDTDQYGGSGQVNTDILRSERIASHGRDDSLSLTLPPLATLMLQLVA